MNCPGRPPTLHGSKEREADMGSMARPSLGPDELHVAADAFGAAALRALCGSSGLPQDRVRDILARYIAERALMGERDADTLRDGALECLSLTAEASAEADRAASAALFLSRN